MRDQLLNASASAHYERLPAAQWAMLAILVVNNMQGSLTFSALNVALPYIGEDLEAGAVALAWLPTAFLLANTVFLLPFGYVADRAGRKRSWMTGVLIFGVGSIFAWLAPSIDALIASRVLQGVGTALVQACGLGLLMSVFPAGRRGAAIGWFSASVYVGLFLGPLVGGLLIDYLNWRYIFSFQVPVSAAVLLVTVLFFRGEWQQPSASRFDWVGASLFAIAISAFVFGVSALPDTKAAVPILLAAVMSLVFISHQLKIPEPMLRLRRIRDNQKLSRAILRALCLHGANYPIAILLSLYLQSRFGYSASKMGLLLLTQAVSMAIVAPFAGRLSDRLSPEWLTIFGSALVTLALCVLFVFAFAGDIGLIALGLALNGVGMSLFSTPNQSVAMHAVSDARHGVVGALVAQSRTLGNILGMGVAMTAIAVLVGHQQLSLETSAELRMAARITFAIGIAAALSAIIVSLRKLRLSTVRSTLQNTGKPPER